MMSHVGTSLILSAAVLLRVARGGLTGLRGSASNVGTTMQQLQLEIIANTSTLVPGQENATFLSFIPDTATMTATGECSFIAKIKQDVDALYTAEPTGLMELARDDQLVPGEDYALSNIKVVPGTGRAYQGRKSSDETSGLVVSVNQGSDVLASFVDSRAVARVIDADYDSMEYVMVLNYTGVYLTANGVTESVANTTTCTRVSGPDEPLTCAERFVSMDQHSFPGPNNESEWSFAFSAASSGNNSSPAKFAVHYQGGMVAYRGQTTEVGEIQAFGEICVGDVLGEPFIAFVASVYDPKIESTPFATLLVFHPASRKFLALPSGQNASLPGCADEAQRASLVKNDISCGNGFVAVEVCGGNFNTDCTGDCSGVYAVSVGRDELKIGEPFATRAKIGGMRGPFVGKHGGRRNGDKSLSACIVDGDGSTVYRATVQG